jgi:uncharacterized protein YutE (UPF0331/DUF86 family)
VVEPRRIEELVDRLLANLALLDELAAMPTDELLADPIRLGGAKYYLVIAVEGCIDIAIHIITSEWLRRPADFADAFTVLSQKGLLPDDLAAATRDLALFRNQLLHEYAEVDDARVVAVLHRGRQDLRRFALVAAELAAKATDELGG